ncbi:TraB/GumN family protein [Paucibacter sp. PLA-PC-4]|uniref:TraB/GumN family protein n=1 Tax=Paucibacter sp. PLA-PC-4 TaxID=2993655 RepID=UPI00224994CA|nr:TraB/GumN family protein [Paucibacter sp. PLA-PC-4]MCX2860394.1 TraB/GumN family protein [Paucibacter sp. PLA-PC-4]
MMMRPLLLSLLLLWIPARDALAEKPCPPAPAAPAASGAQRDRGLLWRISKNGRSAWLFGSIHLGRPDWARPGPQLQAALQDSDTLALELDPADLQVQRQLAAGLSRPLAVDAALRERLAAQAAAACLPEGALAALHPLMQAITLTMLEARWEGLVSSHGQEMVLSEQARARGLAVVSLETVRQQLDALLPADVDEARRLTADTLEQLEQGKVRPMLRRLVRAWEQGDLQTLSDYERWCDCADTPADRAFLRRLIEGRNPALAARIDALHSQGRKLFVAVGALHMPGPQGLPALLAQRGYQVERVALPAH